MKIVRTLKTVNPYFSQVWEGKKTFELRRQDRIYNHPDYPKLYKLIEYKVGDIYCLAEYDPGTNSFSGRAVLIEITYVLSLDQLEEFAIDVRDTCVFSFKVLTKQGENFWT